METLREAFKNKYPDYSDNILNRFEKITHEKATWENITKVNLDKFVKGLQKQVARSSAKTYCAMMKSILNLYSDEVELPRGFNEMLTIKKDTSQHVYLTEEEVQKIINYEPKNDTERAVRNQFILGVLTGARYSDYIFFTQENIFRNTLRYVSRKTRTEASIPCAPAVKRIIQENEKYGFVGLEFSLTTFNPTIRDICKNVGIAEKIKLYQAGKWVEGEKWEFVSSHTARRTAATLLYLKGIDVYQISKILGHSNIAQTEKYICVSMLENNPKLTEFYRQFQ